MTRPLANITREVLEPVWMRNDIPTKVIAARLGVTRQGLSYKAHSLGLPSRFGNKDCCKKCPDDVFRRMYQAGVSLQDIANECGYTRRQSVTQRRKMMGLPARSSLGAPIKPISLDEFFEMEFGRLMKCDAARINRKVGLKWRAT